MGARMPSTFGGRPAGCTVRTETPRPVLAMLSRVRGGEPFTLEDAREVWRMSDSNVLTLARFRGPRSAAARWERKRRGLWG